MVLLYWDKGKQRNVKYCSEKTSKNNSSKVTHNHIFVQYFALSFHELKRETYINAKLQAANKSILTGMTSPFPSYVFSMCDNPSYCPVNQKPSLKNNQQLLVHS